MRLVLSLALAIALTACGAHGGADNGGTDGPVVTATPTSEPPASEPQSSRCEPGSAALVSAIESGLTVTGGGSLSNAYVVKSGDFENVYFVAARIEGEGLSDSVGVWATNGPAGDASIFAAEAFAPEFSDWGEGPGFTASDDGLSEARDCVES